MRSAVVIALVILALVVMPCTAFAGAFEVAPTTLTLTHGARSGAVYITNRGNAAVIAQIEVFDWDQENSADHLSSSKSLMVSPPMMRLMPGQKQTVRLAVGAGGQSDKERAFRLLISQLPDAAAPKESGVQVLLQFSVPVFVTSTPKTPPQVEWSVVEGSEGPTLVAHNVGTRHVKLSHITVTTSDNKPVGVVEDSFRYILADGSCAWKMNPQGIKAQGPLSVKAQDENDGALHAPVFKAQ